MKEASDTNMTSPSGEISFSRAFITFVLLAMGVSVLLTCGLAAFTAERESTKIASKAHQRHMETLHLIITSFVGHQQHILRDHANFPIITQAVMQPDSLLDRVSDFMGTLSFLGKKYQLVLLDCYGSSIYSTLPEPRFDYTHQNWPLDSQVDMKSYFGSINEENGAFYWRLAAPILYNGSVQGFLVAELPISVTYPASGFESLLADGQLDILSGGKCVSTTGQANGEVLESAVDGTAIVLRYTNNMNAITATRNALILRVVVLLSVLIVITIVIAVWIGKRVFIMPLEALRTKTSALSHSERSMEDRQLSKIKEIKWLSAEFDIMAKTVLAREQELQQVNAELETRVYQRTEDLQKSHDTLEENVNRRTAQLQQSQQQLRGLNARLQATQEEDRQHISREIHDELGTVLTALKYDLAWIKRRMTNSTTAIDDKLKAMSDTVDTIVHTIQTICARLRPGLLDDMGLAAAIEWQANKTARMARLACRTDLDEDIDLDQERSTVLFRIFQELMTNVLRHAKANRIQISLKQQGNEIFLKVTDNGIGISGDQLSDKHALGLIGIRERATSHGGYFLINGSTEEGTIAMVTMPINKKGSKDDTDTDM